ncbi:DUF4446 family protein [Patescibacteria group bacterium]|nr:DUF4446 family protein [Patescibacteria group bacterium]
MVLNQTLVFYILIVVIIWLLSLSILLWRSLSHYNRLTKNITKKDLKSLLEQILTDVGSNRETIEILKQTVAETIEAVGFNIQKVGLIRFNPFNETGGNQSFVLVLLDDHGSGVVLNCLHSRASTRIYAKQLKKGKLIAGGQLSKEESQAIKLAQKKHRSGRNQ